MIRLVGVVMLGLKAWMLYDAYRRRAERHWFWIILGVPGGSVLYFIAVRAQDHDARQATEGVLALFRRPPGLDELRADFEDSPSHQHRLRLAQGLFDAQHVSDARAHFRAMHAARADDPDVSFGLALCEIELGEHGAGIELLRGLIERKPAHNDFAAYPVLARALYATGEEGACMELLHGLARREPRLPHVVLLARYLRRQGDEAGAAVQLRDALRQHERAPRHVRKQYGHAARSARKLLSSLPA